MRRRLIALLVGVLVVLVAFTAAAVASGVNPLGLMPDKSATQADHALRAKHKAKQLHATTTQPQQGGPADDSSRGDELGDDDEDGSKTQADPSAKTTESHKLRVCHHTGSWKHPVHEISVDEHALPALQAHGDTLGACPTTSTQQRPAHPQHPVHPSPAGHVRGKGNGRGEERDEHSHGDEEHGSKKG